MNTEPPSSPRSAVTVPPVETVEDVREIGGIDSRPMVSYRDGPVLDRHLDGGAVSVPLDGVVEQISDRTCHRNRRGLDHGGLEVRPEGDRRAASDIRKRFLGEVIEPGLLLLRRLDVPSRKLHELLDQVRHLPQLDQCVRDDAPALVGGERVVELEELEIGARRGERRSQLVRRVGDELALRAHRAREGLEHGVEGARQATELVGSAFVRPLAQVAGRCDALRVVRQPRHRAQAPARNRHAKTDGAGYGRKRHRQEQESNPTEHAVDLCERARDLDGGLSIQAGRVDAHVRAADGCVFEGRSVLPGGDRNRAGDREADLLARREPDLASGADELDVSSRAAEPRTGQVLGRLPRRRRLRLHRPAEADEHGRALAQRIVDFGSQLTSHDEVRRDEAGADRERQCAGGPDRETGAQAQLTSSRKT